MLTRVGRSAGRSPVARPFPPLVVRLALDPVGATCCPPAAVGAASCG